MDLENKIKSATEDRDSTLEEIEQAGLTVALKNFRDGKWLSKEDQKLIDAAVDLRFKIFACYYNDERQQYVEQHKALIEDIESKDLLDDYLLGLEQKHYIA